MPPAHHSGNLYSDAVKTVLCLPCSLHKVGSATQGMLERHCQCICGYNAQEGWGFFALFCQQCKEIISEGQVVLPIQTEYLLCGLSLFLSICFTKQKLISASVQLLCITG